MKTASPELNAAIAKATAIYNENTAKLAAFSKELDISSGYHEAEKEVARLYSEFLENE
jgi:hypothetical protein